MQKPSENPINLRKIQKKAYENQKKTSEKIEKAPINAKKDFPKEKSFAF